MVHTIYNTLFTKYDTLYTKYDTLFTIYDSFGIKFGNPFSLDFHHHGHIGLVPIEQLMALQQLWVPVLAQ